MRREEASRISEWIVGLSLSPGAICLNIGSSTERFRTRSQPHSEHLLFQPLRRSGLRVLHCDMKPDPGVDLVGDVLDPAFQQELREMGAQLLICSNVLEHLADPEAFAASCAGLVSPGGYALFTVPANYPFHPDPIDTMFRPTPDELAAMFPAWQVVKAETLVCGDFWDDLKNEGGFLRNSARHLLRVALPFYRPRYWVAAAHRLLWLVRKYQVTMLLIRNSTLSEASTTNSSVAEAAIESLSRGENCRQKAVS